MLFDDIIGSTLLYISISALSTRTCLLLFRPRQPLASSQIWLHDLSADLLVVGLALRMPHVPPPLAMLVLEVFHQRRPVQKRLASVRKLHAVDRRTQQVVCPASAPILHRRANVS
eukprot:1202233-Rhodomonas_salina.5